MKGDIKYISQPKVTTKSVCQALMKQFMITGVPVSIWSDNASNFTGKLTREFLLKLGCQPRFSTPSHPQAAGLCERWVGTLKSMVSKVAQDHPRQWHQYLDYIVWALRETPNQTTGIQPWVLAFGYLPRGPLSILKESWTGERELPLDLGKSPTEYLAELRNNLETANAYADSHTTRAQQRYATHYNLRSRDKHFTVGEKVLILTPDSSASKVFSRWKGPATIAEVRSPYSYIVDYDGKRQHLHANKLRKFRIRVDEIVCNAYDEEMCNSDVMCVNSALVYDQDCDFGDVAVVEPNDLSTFSRKNEFLPSEKINRKKLSHLTEVLLAHLLHHTDSIFMLCARVSNYGHNFYLKDQISI